MFYIVGYREHTNDLSLNIGDIITFPVTLEPLENWDTHLGLVICKSLNV